MASFGYRSGRFTLKEIGHPVYRPHNDTRVSWHNHLNNLRSSYSSTKNQEPSDQNDTVFIRSKLRIPDRENYADIAVPMSMFNKFASDLWNARKEYGTVEAYTEALEHFVKDVTVVYPKANFVDERGSASRQQSRAEKVYCGRLQEMNLNSGDFGFVQYMQIPQTMDTMDSSQSAFATLPDFPILNDGIVTVVRTSDRNSKTTVPILNYISGETGGDTELQITADNAPRFNGQDPRINDIVNLIHRREGDLTRFPKKWSAIQQELRATVRDNSHRSTPLSVAVYTLKGYTEGDEGREVVPYLHACFVNSTAQMLTDAMTMTAALTDNVSCQHSAAAYLGNMVKFAESENRGSSYGSTWQLQIHIGVSTPHCSSNEKPLAAIVNADEIAAWIGHNASSRMDDDDHGDERPRRRGVHFDSRSGGGDKPPSRKFGFVPDTESKKGDDTMEEESDPRLSGLQKNLGNLDQEDGDEPADGEEDEELDQEPATATADPATAQGPKSRRRSGSKPKKP